MTCADNDCITLHNLLRQVKMTSSTNCIKRRAIMGPEISHICEGIHTALNGLTTSTAVKKSKGFRVICMQTRRVWEGVVSKISNGIRRRASKRVSNVHI